MTWRWPWRRPKAPSEATRSRMQAERDLEATRAETPKVKALAQALIEFQETNHLGQNAIRVLRGGK